MADDGVMENGPTSCTMDVVNWEDFAPTEENLLGQLKIVEVWALSSDDFKPLPQFEQAEVADGEMEPEGLKAFSELYLKYVDEESEDELDKMASSQEERLRLYEAKCEKTAAGARDALEALRRLTALHEAASAGTRGLHETCEHLLEEQTSLAGRLAALAGPAAHYAALAELAPALGLPAAALARAAAADTEGGGGSGGGAEGAEDRALAEVALEPKVRPGTDEFDEVLRRLEASQRYLAGRPAHRDGALYRAKAARLRRRALALAQRYVLDQFQALRAATEAQLAARPPPRAGREAAAAVLETSPLYAKYKGLAPRTRRCIALLRRAAAEEGTEGGAYDEEGAAAAGAFLEEVEAAFAEHRRALLRPPVRAHLLRLAPAAAPAAATAAGGGGGGSQQPPDDGPGAAPPAAAAASAAAVAAALRGGAAYVGRVGRLEEGVWAFCLRGEDPQGMEEGANMDVDKPGRESAVFDMLSSVNDDFYHMLRPLILQQHDIDDLCEIISVIREEIFGDTLKREEEAAAAGGAAAAALERCLRRVAEDAEERLILCARRRLEEDVALHEPTDAELDYPATLERAAAATAGGADPFASWYPPLRATLMVLSKIYRSVGRAVFEDLAQQACLVATHALAGAAVRITAKQTEIDGDLFLIKHLLIMREQLTPFDIQFLTVEKHLDFTATAAAFANFLARPTQLLSPGAFLQFAQDGLPRINETTLDAKQELEATLKAACQRLIARAADRLVEPLASWLRLANAFVAGQASASNRGGGDAEAPAIAPKLRDQAFALEEAVHAALAAAAAAVRGALPPLLAALALYLDARQTQAVLFKPVQRKFLETVSQMKDVLEAHYTPQEFSGFWNALNALSEQVLPVDLVARAAAAATRGRGAGGAAAAARARRGAALSPLPLARTESGGAGRHESDWGLPGGIAEAPPPLGCQPSEC